MRVIYYNSLQQKKEAKIAAHARGESTIHDDFINLSMQPTDGTTGRLTFDKKPNPKPRKILGLNEINKRLKDKTLDYTDLLDLLEIQALKISTTRWENFKALFGK